MMFPSLDPLLQMEIQEMGLKDERLRILHFRGD